MVDAHRELVRHASCAPGTGGYGSDSDGDGDQRVCPCQYHDVLIEQLDDARAICASWPGPFCNTCWRASCACGYVFEDPADARGTTQSGRLYCYNPTCRPA